VGVSGVFAGVMFPSFHRYPCGYLGIGHKMGHSSQLAGQRGQACDQARYLFCRASSGGNGLFWKGAVSPTLLAPVFAQLLMQGEIYRLDVPDGYGVVKLSLIKRWIENTWIPEVKPDNELKYFF